MLVNDETPALRQFSPLSSVRLGVGQLIATAAATVVAHSSIEASRHSPGEEPSVSPH